MNWTLAVPVPDPRTHRVGRLATVYSRQALGRRGARRALVRGRLRDGCIAFHITYTLFEISAWAKRHREVSIIYVHSLSDCSVIDKSTERSLDGVIRVNGLAARMIRRALRRAGRGEEGRGVLRGLRCRRRWPPRPL